MINVEFNQVYTPIVSAVCWVFSATLSFKNMADIIRHGLLMTVQKVYTHCQSVWYKSYPVF